MGKESEIKLLGAVASPYSNRVQFALNLKSIKYDYIEEKLAPKSELLITSNPVHKMVPVLFHADKPPICESQIILEYLDEIRLDLIQLLPSNYIDQASCRFWTKYIDTKFIPLYEEMRQTKRMAGKEAIKEQMIEATQLLEEAFIKFSNGKPYFGGDEVGYLDVVLGCIIRWTKLVDELNDFTTFDEVRTYEVRIPKLAKWAKNISSHEALKNATPDDEALVNFYAMLNVYKPPVK